MLFQNRGKLRSYFFLFRFEFAKPAHLININLFVIEILELVGSCDVLLKEIKAYNNYAQITPLSLYMQFVKHKTPTPCSCIDHHHHHHNDGGELGAK